MLNGTVQHDYFGNGENKVKSVNPYPSTFLAVKAMTHSAYKVLLVEKDQPELLEKVNAGLKSLKENGTYATLTTK